MLLTERYNTRPRNFVRVLPRFLLRLKFAPLFERFQVFRERYARKSRRDNRVYDANSGNNSHPTVEQIFAIRRSIIYLPAGDMKEKVHPCRRARE